MLHYFTPAAHLMRDIARYRQRPMPLLCLMYVDGQPVVGVSLEQAALKAEEERLDARVRALTDREEQIAAARALSVAANAWAEWHMQQTRGLDMLVAGRRWYDMRGEPKDLSSANDTGD